MKDGMRFVDRDMHIMEPKDLFDRYLETRIFRGGARLYEFGEDHFAGAARAAEKNRAVAAG